MARFYTNDPDGEFRKLRSSGRAKLPQDPIRARSDARDMLDRARYGSIQDDFGGWDSGRPAMSEGREALINNGYRGISPQHLAQAGPDALEAINAMHKQRTASPGMGMSGGGMGNSQVAWPKLRDPFEQFREKAWWFLKEGDFNDSLRKVREWVRLVYMTHPLVPALIDIYSRFPLLDIEFKHKDDKLADFYNELFLNQLNYQEFLFDMSKEYWLVGEAFPLGSWHDGIGAWDDDELLNPDDVQVSRNSVLRQYQYHLKIPAGIKKLIETRKPREEYEMLMKFYPHIVSWAKQNKEMPVSNVLLKHLKFKVNPWEPHGVPILLRAFKTLMLEMSLEAAQDAVADRLYSPLILANLGIEDVGDGEGPWIPEPEDIEALRDDLSLALMSDFRLMVYHHGLNIQSVFGRESMPRFDTDFDRVDARLMQIFGIGPELLQGGSASAPYASGALNRELITQMLSTYQISIQRFLRDRMRVVAEVQGHFEYEKRGSQRYPVYQTVLMQNEETGEEYVEERPKLAIPEVQFRVMNLRDESVERQFLMELRNMGVPIADTSMLVNVPVEFDDEVVKLQREKMDKVLAELHYQKRLFTAIFMNQLPIPPEYLQQYMQYLANMQPVAMMQPGTDVTDGSPSPNLFPMVQPSVGDLTNAQNAQLMGSNNTMADANAGGDMVPAESTDVQAGAPMQATAGFRMYASAEERQEFLELGEEEWMRQHGIWEELEEYDSSIDSRISSVIQSSYTEELPDDFDLERERIRVTEIKSMDSPEHMKWSRKMVLPEGTRIKEATEEIVVEVIEDEGISVDGVEGDGDVLGEDD